MALAVCPNGHTSDSLDYCDICGSPIDAGAVSGGGAAPDSSGAPSAPAEAKPLGVVCPNCGVMNAPGALFCEACGYDYTTGTMPRPAEASVLDLDAPLPPAATPPAVTPPVAPVASSSAASGPGYATSAGSPAAPGQSHSPGSAGALDSLLDLDAPLAGAPATGSASHPPAVVPPQPPASTPPQPPVVAGAPATGSTPVPPPGVPSQPSVVAPPAFDAPTGGRVPATAAPAGNGFDWVLEMWVDPEWYALQESPDPMPSAGLPEIMPLRKRSLLIGRPSRSRGIDPDIDCEPDTGISRRQAQLTTDGSRWFIEDLDSANGTFVAEAAGGMPTTPIPSGRRRELTGDERIYLGAWTRLVLRRATPEEVDAYATA